MKSTQGSGPISDDVRRPFDNLLQRYQQDPAERSKNASVRSFTQDTYKEGLLAKVLEKAGDAILSASEIRQLLTGTNLPKTAPELDELKLPFEALVAAVSDEAVITQFSTSGKMMGSSLFFMFAPLLAESAVSLIMKALEPQYPQIAQKTTKELETFLQTLLGLKLQQFPPDELQRLLPSLNSMTPQTLLQELKFLKEAALQINVPRYAQTSPEALKQALQEAKVEFDTLFSVAKSEAWDTSPIAAFKGMPEQALSILNQASGVEKGWVMALMGVFLANRQTVHAAVLQRPYEELKSQRVDVKERWEKEAIVPLTEEEEKKLALIDQLLLCPPILANYLIIKQLLNDLEERLKEQKDKTLSLVKILLCQACYEVRQIASGKATFEYPHVGVMHTEIERLVKKIEPLLPKKPQDLTAQNATSLTNALNEHLAHIKQENPSSLALILKSHPRTLLYLLYAHSPVLEDMSVPYGPTLNDSLSLGIEQAFIRLANIKGFSRFQPHVLKTFFEQSKKEPTSELSKCSLRVVFRAFNEQISSLDSNERQALQFLLQQ